MNERKKSLSTTDRQTAVAGARNFVRGVVTEMRRVTWPTRDEWVSATLLTIGLVIGVGLFVYAADWLFSYIFNLAHPILR